MELITQAIALATLCVCSLIGRRLCGGCYFCEKASRPFQKRVQIVCINTTVLWTSLLLFRMLITYRCKPPSVRIVHGQTESGHLPPSDWAASCCDVWLPVVPCLQILNATFLYLSRNLQVQGERERKRKIKIKELALYISLIYQ